MDEPQDLQAPVVVIGAGPAGLTAAYELTERRVPVVVFEQDTELGGIARTVEYKGFRFDLGGHRFFTKVRPVADLWRTMLGDELLRRPRLSRIYYRGRFFDYPLKAGNALGNLGVGTSVSVGLSYLWAKAFPIQPEVSFEDWVTNRFGRRLFDIFFRTYTEKVWGIPCQSIGAQWAAQRIKGLSLRTAVINMLFSKWMAAGAIKTLIDEFDYPRHGPGMMWDAFARHITAGGGRIELGSRVVGLRHEAGAIAAVEVEQHGHRWEVPASHVISTMPIRQLVHAISPALSPEAKAAADRLKYRDFLTVALIADDPDVFPDNWIYIHDDAVKVGRIQNFKNWSPDMVPDPSKSCLGMEYFCFEGDGLWTMSDPDLIALGTREIEQIGLVAPGRIRDGAVVRMPKAYPVYDEGYEDALERIKQHLAPFSNLQLVGRNGMHRYNNQDHSMLTAMLAVRNILGASFDLWGVNADEEYHEEAREDDPTLDRLERDLRELAATQPMVPTRIAPAGATRGTVR